MLNFDSSEDYDTAHGINITPLVDVCLTLVLIFMVVMPASVINAINVRSQTLKKYGLSTPQENIQVHLTKGGIYVKDAQGEEQKVRYDHVGMVLSEMIQISPSKRLLLRSERNVPQGQVVWILDIAKQNGAQDLSLMGGE